LKQAESSPTGMPMIRLVAVGVDGSVQSEQAFTWAADLAKLTSSSLTIVAVIPVHRANPAQASSPLVASVEDRRAMNELLSRLSKIARGLGVEVVDTLVLEGSAVDRLLDVADERAPDLLVLGARGISATRRLLLGSVSDGVLHHASCSVLVVRPPSPKATGRPKAKS